MTTQEPTTETRKLRVTPLDDDRVTEMHVYRCDHLADLRELRTLREVVVRLQVDNALKDDRIAELVGQVEARPRWYILRLPAFRAPTWSLGPLAGLAIAWSWVARLASKVNRVSHALYHCDWIDAPSTRRRIR